MFIMYILSVINPVGYSTFHPLVFLTGLIGAWYGLKFLVDTLIIPAVLSFHRN